MKKQDVLRHLGKAADVARVLEISPAAVSLWGDYVPKQWWRKLNEVSQGALKLPLDHEIIRQNLRDTFNVEGSIKGQFDEGGVVSSPGSRCLVSNQHFQLREFSKVVNSLEPHLFIWVRHCYGNERPEIAAPCTLITFERFLKGSTPLSDSSLSLIKLLNALAAQCVVASINTGKPLYNGPALRSVTLHSEATWKKHWAKRWRELRQIWLELDRQALEFIDANYSK